MQGRSWRKRKGQIREGFMAELGPLKDFGKFTVEALRKVYCSR